MNKRLVFKMIGKMLLLEAALMLLPLITSVIYRGTDITAFLISGLLCGACGFALSRLRPGQNNINIREGVAVAGFGWLILSLFGALPLTISGAIPSYIDSLFETVSGFTTTGASLLTNIESLPKGSLFWRSFTHWVGGMGVLVLSVAIMPNITGRSANLAKAESPGPVFSKLVPKMQDSAKILYLIYIGLSVLEFVSLLICGMSCYDAMLHTFGTAGTGGFSNYSASIGTFASPAVEWVIGVFMLLFGINFASYFHFLRKEYHAAVKSEELWVYLIIVFLSTVLITGSIANRYPFGEAIRTAFFQTTSILSTTGYSTVDFNAWPALAKLILLFLMCTGGCAGSTAGGLKVCRLIILAKGTKRSIKKTLVPREVKVIKFEGRPVPDDMLINLGSYLFLCIGIIVLGALLLMLDRSDITTCLTASATCFFNVGPGFNAVGPAGNFAFFSPFSKLLLSLIMLTGRLEIYSVIVLFFPRVWKKN